LAGLSAEALAKVYAPAILLNPACRTKSRFAGRGWRPQCLVQDFSYSSLILNALVLVPEYSATNSIGFYTNFTSSTFGDELN